MTDVNEAQKLELRRSSRTEVSQAIATIDDDRTLAVQGRRRVSQNSAQRNVNGAADVCGVVFVRRQHVDDLRDACGEHRGKLAMLNFAHDYARIEARAERAVSTIVSPLPGAIRAVSTS